MARTVAIGEQDFGKLIEKNCFYVDKTNFIKEWWESEDTVTLIARPGRFGKTLAMHMLRDFFSIRDAGRGRLFENLAVWQDERYQRLQGTYPVIFLSFAAVKEHRYDTARKKICQMIVNLYSDFYFLLQEGFLDEKEEAFFRRISADMDDADATEALSQLGRRPDAVWSLLAACGYLKVTGCCRRDGREEYTLAIVNFEVQEMFGQMFLDWFSDESCQYSDFKEALLSGDIQRMNAYLNEILFYTLSRYDTGKRFSKSRIHENFYHGFVLGLIAGLRSRYVISSNRESGFGRYDVMLLPLNPADDGMILEFKVMDADKEQSLQDTVDAALRQIIEKKYFAELEAEGIRRENIRIYGFAFTGKEVLAGGGPAPAYEQEYKG